MRRRITLLGATGSVGASAADVILAAPDRFDVHAVTANTNADKLADTARRLGAKRAVLADPDRYGELKDTLFGSGIAAGAGANAVEDAASEPADMVLSAIVGAAGLRATAAAVRAGSDIALANKECLVCAGPAFMALAKAHDVRILPVDSEHNALHQLIESRDRGTIRTYTLTASGGPFRTWPAERMAAVTPAEAIRHPTWSMGAKISVDSATLMNKGLELVEAMHLFGLDPERLDVVVHPQSVVHAMITFTDGSIHAELGPADMRRPIGYCLHWPERAGAPPSTLDLVAVGRLDFERPDTGRFPALALALAALRRGDGSTTVLNAANEVAVEAFLAGRLRFTAIAETVETVLGKAERDGLLTVPDSVEAALALDGAARQLTRRDMDQRSAA